MDKIKNFFRKNYDYYILLILLVISITTRLVSYYSYKFYSNVPCILLQQAEFIYFSILRYILFVLPNYGGLFGILFESFIGSVILFGVYFLGKKLYSTKRKWLKILLKILLFLYVFNLISAFLITPIARCVVFGGMF